MSLGPTVVGALRVNLGLDTAEFDKGVKNANNITYNLQRNLKNLIPGIGAVGGALAALGARAVASATEIQRFAQISNASSGEFQRWAAGARTVGIEQDKLADIMKDVNDRVGDYFATGAGPMVDFFENIAPKVGITAEAFRGLSGPEALQLYVSSLEKAGASQQDMTFYLEAMASDTTLLIPLLKNGGAEMKRLGEAAQAAGAVMDDKTIASLGRTKSAMTGLRTNIDGLTNILVAEAAPAIERISNALASLAANDTVKAVVGGIAANFDHIAAFAGAAAIVIAGRFVSSLVMVNGKVMTLSRTIGYLSTLRLGSLFTGIVGLAGGPLTAAIAAAALIGTEIMLWKSNTADASSALDAHNRILDGVRSKYADLKSEVKDWAQVVKDTTGIQAAANLSDLRAAQQKERERFRKDLGNELANEMNLSLLGDTSSLDSGWVRGILTHFEEGRLTIEQTKAELEQLHAQANATQQATIAAALNQLDAMRPAQQAIAEAQALVVLTSQTATQAERDAAAATLNLAGTAAAVASTAGVAADAAAAATGAAAKAAEDQLRTLKQKNELTALELAKGAESIELALRKNAIDAENETRAINLQNISQAQKDLLIAQVDETRRLADQMAMVEGAARMISGTMDSVSASISNAVANALNLAGALARAATSFNGAMGAIANVRAGLAEVRAAGAALMSGDTGPVKDVLKGAAGALFGGPSEEEREAMAQAAEARAEANAQADETLRLQKQQNELATLELSNANDGLDLALRRNAIEAENELLRINGLDVSQDRKDALIAEANEARRLADELTRGSAAERAAKAASRGAGGGGKGRSGGGGGGGKAAGEAKPTDAEREAMRVADSQGDALRKLQEEHQRYQQTLGMSALEERIFQSVQQTGALGDAEKAATVRQLVVETDALKRAQEELRAVVNAVESGFEDLFVGVITGTKSASDSIKDLGAQLAKMVASSAFKTLWNGTGHGFGGIGGLVNNFFGGAFGMAGGGGGGGDALSAALGAAGAPVGGGGLFGGIGNILGGLFGANANGTPNWSGGLTWVGERGPELVNLSRGSKVLSNPASKRLVEGGGGQSRVVVELAPGLVADIVGQANDNAVQIVQTGLSTYDNKHSAQTFGRHSADPRARG